MKLMEEKYIPHTLNELISPNLEELLSQLKTYLKEQKNILFIGSNQTYKSVAMKLALREYYGVVPKDSVLILDTFKDL